MKHWQRFFLATVTLFGFGFGLALGISPNKLAADSISFTAEEEPSTRRPVREAFLLHCSGCHRADGRGIPNLAPDLRMIGELLSLKGGRSYLGRVPGVAQAPLDDEGLARLLNWVLTDIANTPPKPAYTAAELRNLRAKPLRDPVAARQALFSPAK